MQMAQRLLSTRGGTIAVGAFAAALAAVILLGYLHRYRSSLDQATAPVPVLVAKGLIEKGTPGNVVGNQDLFQVATIPRDEVKEGAFADPASLNGQIAADDIYPGQQLTTADFTGGSTDAVATKVVEYERGMAIPVDEAHGMIGNVRVGDRVDVIAALNVEDGGGKQIPVVRMLVQDVAVLEAPAEATAAGIGAGATGTKSVVLKLTDDEAALVAFASENGKIWLIVRPKSGAEQHLPSIVTIQRMLVGLRPIPAAPQEGEKPWTGGAR